MSTDLKTKFNELAALNKVMGDLGKNMMERDLISEDVYEAVEKRHEEESTYGALDYSAFLKVQKEGPESVGFEKACAIMEYTLTEGNLNTNVVLQFVDAAKARECLPAGIDAAKISALADKYKIESLKKLLPK